MMVELSPDEEFRKLIDRLKKRSGDNIDLVNKAFNMARKLHEGQSRKSGEEYIFHPLAVAKCLDKLGFDADVICAGLLHDVVEDCDITISDIKEEFNEYVAEIVEAVTAINEKEFVADEKDIFEDNNFKYFSMKEQTYKKLLAIGKKNRLAFYIKFADRVHNLSTIGVFDEFKRMAKVMETEKYILPIAYYLKSNFFYENLKNQCFFVKNIKFSNNFYDIFSRYYKLNKNIYYNLKNIIYQNLEKYLNKEKIKAKISDIIFEKEMEYRVFNEISKLIGIGNLDDMKQSFLNKVPTQFIHIVLNGNISEKKCNDILFDVLDKKLFGNLTLINYYISDEFNEHFFIVQDEYKNKYKIRVFTQKSFSIYRVGSVDGLDVDFDEDVSTIEPAKYINIKTRSGEIVKLPENATVLDFAFKIHKDIGFASKHAFINDSPVKMPLYSRLNDGDKVNIVVEKDDETGEMKNVAKIRWLAYVKTENAQRALIKHFEKLE